MCDKILSASLKVAVVLFVISFIGCDRSSPNPAHVIAAKDTPEELNAEADARFQSEAKNKLKTVLDSWAFGDSAAQCQVDHPEIDLMLGGPKKDDRVGLMFWTFNKFTLIRYEIGPSRVIANVAQFKVTFVFQSKAGPEITKTKQCYVWKDVSDKWLLELSGTALDSVRLKNDHTK